MENNNKGIVAALLVTLSVTILVLGYTTYFNQRRGDQTGFINGGANARMCNVTTTAVVSVGKDIAVTLSATTSRRAYLHVQPVGTTTLALAFNGAIASSTTNQTQYYSWLVATQATNSTSSPVYRAGLNTENPYTGAVSAISLVGTSTALVTECVYNQ